MQSNLKDGDQDLSGLFDQLVSLAEESSATFHPKPRGKSSGTAALPHAPDRVDELGNSASGASPELAASAKSADGFFPTALGSLEETQVGESLVEAIILRYLLLHGSARGVEISRQIGLPFGVAEGVLQSLKTQRLLAHKSAGTLTDFIYEITEAGANKLQTTAAQCNYCGTVPVSLADYTASVAAQSPSQLRPKFADLQRAFTGLTLSQEMFSRLGLAIAAGRGLFLHGRPGNGKSYIAERVTAVYGTSIWIPRAISVGNEIIRVFDPSCHEELPLAKGVQILSHENVDDRWVRIRRPTIIVGGELTMKNLEITANEETGVSEASVQMKSNCGTLVIDDFGRQRISPQELLNRWIVPLEKRIDYLGLASGRKISVPFDQFIVFSTNLEPQDLVDEAFLRRIPYKIEVENPSLEQFRKLYEQTCAKMGLEFRKAALDHLLSKHYEQANRELRFCHPRDLLTQVAVFCKFLELPPAASIEALDIAAKNYFSAVVH